MVVTLLEKRLIGLSHLGIRIEHDGGHRWIQAVETDTFDFNKECERQKIYPCKVYGGIICALDEVDRILKNTSKKSLLEVYNTLVLWYNSEREDYIITCDNNGE